LKQGLVIFPSFFILAQVPASAMQSGFIHPHTVHTGVGDSGMEEFQGSTGVIEFLQYIIVFLLFFIIILFFWFALQYGAMAMGLSPFLGVFLCFAPLRHMLSTLK
jgi:hypothetical protein